MKKRTKKILIGILIGFLVLILLLFGAFLALKHYVSNTLLGGVSTTELLTVVEEVLEDEEVQKYLNSEDPSRTEKLMEQVKEAKKESGEQAPEATQAVSNVNSEAFEKAREMTVATPAPTPTENPASANVPNKYKQAIKSVDPRDLADAAKLVGRADVGYILGYVGGGISTPDRRSELYAYLRQSYSPSEIARGVELFVKYAHLL